MARLSLSPYTQVTNSGALTTAVAGVQEGLHTKLTKFAAADVAAQRRSAAVATNTARSSFKRRRDLAPVRPGRSGQGKMTSFIQYARVANESGVALKVKDLDKAAPHWIIQEVGTGNTANISRASEAGPVSYRVMTIPSQKGRIISSGLVFAAKGRYVQPQPGGGTDALVPIGTFPNARRRTRPLRIKREIEGQGFVKKGSQEGFREYRTSVLAAARRHLQRGAR